MVNIQKTIKKTAEDSRKHTENKPKTKKQGIFRFAVKGLTFIACLENEFNAKRIPH